MAQSGHSITFSRDLSRCICARCDFPPEDAAEHRAELPTKDAANNKRLAVIRKMEPRRIDYTPLYGLVFIGLVTIATIVAPAAAMAQ